MKTRASAPASWFGTLGLTVGVVGQWSRLAFGAFLLGFGAGLTVFVADVAREGG